MHDGDEVMTALRDARRDAEIGVIVAAEMLHRSGPDDHATLWQILGERIAEYRAASAKFEAGREQQDK